MPESEPIICVYIQKKDEIINDIMAACIDTKTIMERRDDDDELLLCQFDYFWPIQSFPDLQSYCDECHQLLNMAVSSSFSIATFWGKKKIL